MITLIKSILGMNKEIKYQSEVDNFIDQLSTYKYYNGSK